MTAMIMAEEAHDKGHPQRTIFYLTVPSIDNEVKRLKKLGATVHKAAVAVPNAGKYGYVKVPGDLVFGLWESVGPSQPKVAKKTKEADATVTFFEIFSSDPEAAVAFLSKALAWNFTSYPIGGKPYWYSGGDGKSFSVGLRGLEKGEKGTDLIAHVNKKSASDALKAVAKLGAKKVGAERSYGPYGKSQLFKAPGGFTMGFYEGGTHSEKKEEKKEETPSKKVSPKKVSTPKGKKTVAQKGKKTVAPQKKKPLALKKAVVKGSPAKKAAAAKKKPSAGGVTKAQRAPKK